MADPRDSFGPVAERYATSAVHANPVALARLIELVQPKGGRLLDVATGAGNTAVAFAPYVDHVVAADVTPEMIAVCLGQADKKGLGNVEGVVARAETLPFRTGAFDGVTCRIAPHHFDHPPMFVGEVKRVVRPGGWFLLIDNVGPEDPMALVELDAIERDRDPSHRSYLSAELWRAMLLENGFQIRFEETAEKMIDTDDWLARMGVPATRWEPIKRRILGVEGPLRAYLQPTDTSFRLREHLFLADNPE